MAAAGFKPLGPSRIIMDTSLAMSLLGRIDSMKTVMLVNKIGCVIYINALVSYFLHSTNV